MGGINHSQMIKWMVYDIVLTTLLGINMFCFFWRGEAVKSPRVAASWWPHLRGFFPTLWFHGKTLHLQVKTCEDNGFKRRLPIFPIHYSWFLEHLPANIPQIASHHIPILSLFCSVKYPSYLYIVLLVESAILIKWYYINFGIGWILSLRVEFPLHRCPGQNMD